MTCSRKKPSSGTSSSSLPAQSPSCTMPPQSPYRHIGLAGITAYAYRSLAET